MATIDDLRSARIENIEELKRRGVDPNPALVRRDHSVGQARAMDGQEVAVAGRIMSLRGHGKILFGDLRDESGEIQVVWKADLLGENTFANASLLAIGDFVSVAGRVGKTEAGELSVFVTVLQIASKSVRPLPDQWYGLKDIEDRYRKRYLDLILNPKVKGVLDSRWKIERAIRTFLWGEGYVEVETPILQPLYGGTNAKPFTTHMNALDSDFYLRVAPELYLKRLIVGGYERVFEIARNFRNEGIDQTHQPEFTMMEFYEAYADYHRIMDLTESLIKFVSQSANQSSVVTVDTHTVDLSGKWRRITIEQAMGEYMNIDWDRATDEEIRALLDRYRLEPVGTYSRNKALFAIYDHVVTAKLIEPTWVIDYPREVSPLSKLHRAKAGRVERFEGYIGGKEICDGWSEIVSGLEQRERFEQEQKNLKAGDTEAHPLDEDFITALEYGCPPLGGIGIGIDRLVMFLTNTWAIKEVIAFPTLRPKVPLVTSTSRPTPAPPGGKSTGLTKEQARELLHGHVANTNLRRHMYAVGFVMRALAEKLGGDPDTWEILGLLHDADWEETKDTPAEHTRKTLGWLKELNIVDGPIVHALMSHNRKHTELADLDGIMEWALETCDELTGFIVAVTLVQPDKKIASVTVESVLKKWNSSGFAKAVDRQQIGQCEERLGILLNEFVALTLRAMQEQAEELGL